MAARLLRGICVAVDVGEFFVAQRAEPGNDKLVPLGFVAAVEQAVDQAAHNNAGHFHSTHGELELLEIGEDLFGATILAELAAAIEEFDAAKI